MTLAGVERATLDELAPLLRRAVTLDAAALARFRVAGGRAGVLVRLPFGVLVSRGVESDGTSTVDVAVRAADALAWLDDAADPPAARDADWRTGLPPDRGWTRLETVPDHVVRPLVRQGALALRDAAEREGVPGAQPRAEVADALLDAVVLTAAPDDAPDGAAGRGEDAPVTLRMLSALTRMGFLARDGHAHVDRAGRWIRVVGQYGTVYAERPGGLQLR